LGLGRSDDMLHDEAVLFHQRLQRRRAATPPRIWCLDFGTLLREKRDATGCLL